MEYKPKLLYTLQKYDPDIVDLAVLAAAEQWTFSSVPSSVSVGYRQLDDCTVSALTGRTVCTSGQHCYQKCSQASPMMHCAFPPNLSSCLETWPWTRLCSLLFSSTITHDSDLFCLPSQNAPLTWLTKHRSLDLPALYKWISYPWEATCFFSTIHLCI